MIGLYHYIVLSAILFCVGVFGILNARMSIISILMSVELMLLAANINFVTFGAYLNNINGQIFTLFVLGVSAAEIAIGLAILVMYFRQNGNIAIDDCGTLKDE